MKHIPGVLDYRLFSTDNTLTRFILDESTLHNLGDKKYGLIKDVVYTIVCRLGPTEMKMKGRVILH